MLCVEDGRITVLGGVLCKSLPSRPPGPPSLLLFLSLSLSLSLPLSLSLSPSLALSVLVYVLNILTPFLSLYSSSRSSRARLTQAVTLLSWQELSTLKSASVLGASITTWTMSAKTLTITPSLRCLATGALETSLRYVQCIIWWCNLEFHLGGMGVVWWGDCGKLMYLLQITSVPLLPPLKKISPYNF